MLKLIRGFFFLLLFTGILGTVSFIAKGPFYSKEEKVLNIFTYSDILDLDMIKAFTKETGIKVNLHLYAGDEVVLTKLKLNKNNYYDLIISSDYVCSLLIKNEFAGEIDKTKLDFLDRLYLCVQDHAFDPGNTHTLPYGIESYGFAYDPATFNKEEFFLNDLFNPAYRKVTTPEQTELLNIGAWSLFGETPRLSAKECQEVTRHLQHQKETVEAYSDFRAKDIIKAGHVPLSLLKSSYIDPLLESSDNIKYALPKDKFFVSIESIVVAKDTKHTDDVYTFLNYIYKAENQALTVDQFPCYPTCSDAFAHTTDHHPRFLEIMEEMEKRKSDMLFFRQLTDEDTAREIIVNVKA